MKIVFLTITSILFFFNVNAQEAGEPVLNGRAGIKLGINNSILSYSINNDMYSPEIS